MCAPPLAMCRQTCIVQRMLCGSTAPIHARPPHTRAPPPALRRWDTRQQALAAAGQPRSAITQLLQAALDAAHSALPQPLRNIAVAGDLAAPLPPPGQVWNGGVGQLQPGGMGAFGWGEAARGGAG